MEMLHGRGGVTDENWEMMRRMVNEICTHVFIEQNGTLVICKGAQFTDEDRAVIRLSLEYLNLPCARAPSHPDEAEGIRFS